MSCSPVVAAQLVELVVKRGGYVNEKVKVAASPHGWGTGVTAVDRVEAGETLVTLPRNSVITPQRCKDDPDVGKALQLAELNDAVTIHMYLAWNKARCVANKPDVPWGAYVDSLPDEPKIPIFFSEPEIRLLSPSTAFDRLGWAIEELSAEYHALRHSSHLANTSLSEVTFQHYRWAVATCLSRMYYIAGTPCILPVGDAFNHSAARGSQWQHDEGTNGYVLHANSSAERGDELFVSYGPGGPQAYFFHYGFVEVPRAMLGNVGAAAGTATAKPGADEDGSSDDDEDEAPRIHTSEIQRIVHEVTGVPVKDLPPAPVRGAGAKAPEEGGDGDDSDEAAISRIIQEEEEESAAASEKSLNGPAPAHGAPERGDGGKSDGTSAYDGADKPHALPPRQPSEGPAAGGGRRRPPPSVAMPTGDNRAEDRPDGAGRGKQPELSVEAGGGGERSPPTGGDGAQQPNGAETAAGKVAGRRMQQPKFSVEVGEGAAADEDEHSPPTGENHAKQPNGAETAARGRRGKQPKFSVEVGEGAAAEDDEPAAVSSPTGAQSRSIRLMKQQLAGRRRRAIRSHGDGVPWWLGTLLDAGAACSSVIESEEDVHLLLRDCLPPEQPAGDSGEAPAWEVEIPAEFAADLKVNVPRTTAVLHHLVETAGLDIDVNRWALFFGPRQETVLLDAPSLCAIRLVYAVDQEHASWFHAVGNKPIGPRSEVAAAAALCGALKERLSALARNLSRVVQLIGAVPTTDAAGTPSGWKLTGTRPANFDNLSQIGGILTHETVLAQRLLEECAMVPLKYLRVTTGKPFVRWK
ncbi:hypothetical protein DIPPA_10253 [Diplonema papillatum]|nr:hypothetical protein DIPPA_10253 [Diplonema papillatum]|eukprot:gene22802-34942_t